MNTDPENKPTTPTDDEHMDAEGLLLAMKGALYVLLSSAHRHEENSIRFFIASAILTLLSGVLLTLHFTL